MRLFRAVHILIQLRTTLHHGEGRGGKAGVDCQVSWEISAKQLSFEC